VPGDDRQIEWRAEAWRTWRVRTGNVTAGAMAQVNVNVPAPSVKDPKNFVRILREIYHLNDLPEACQEDERKPADPPVM
jgi:hypothetical protein